MPSGFIEHIRDLILFENVPLTRHISQLSATLVTCIKLLTLMYVYVLNLTSYLIMAFNCID